MKIIAEIDHGVILQFHGLLYALEYDKKGSGIFDTELSLASISGVSANYNISLRPGKEENTGFGCTIKLSLIENSEISFYENKHCEEVDISEPAVVDLPVGIMDKCTGCGVCAHFCPQQCITMQEDSSGFLYPVIDKNLCVQCNICQVKCPANRKPVADLYTRPFVYAAYSSREKHRKESSSGGLFRELAEGVLSKAGYVYAAKYDPFPTVAFSKIDSAESICSFYGSKYVESRLKDIFIEIKSELHTGRIILFVGLPCQVAALLAFLEKQYLNLYTMDFVCGGVPGPLFFRTWIHTLEEIWQEKIIDYQFRNKALGWPDQISKIVFSSGREIFIDRKRDIFYQDYQKGYNVRKGCFGCRFYGLNSVADVTIGDFNGALNYDWLKGEIYDGISVLCINSEKGSELMQMCREYVVLKETNFIDAARYNYRMRTRRTESEERKAYIKNINLFKEKIFSDFDTDLLCFYRLDGPPANVSLYTRMRWSVYVQGVRDIEYAWYLYYNDNRIYTEWYSSNNYYEYVPEKRGEYYVRVFAKYKDDQTKIYMDSQKIMVM